MSDLTDYDREIVAAAEKWVSTLAPRGLGNWSPNIQRVINAVQAKRDAQRPRCAYADCRELAVQKVYLPKNEAGENHYRCDEHRIEAREL